MPIHASAPAIRERSRANDCPRRMALFDEIFLQLMLREPLAQRDVAVEVLQSMSVHEPVILRFIVGRPAGGNRLAHHGIDLLRLSRDKHTSASVLFVAPQISLGVKVLNLSWVRA